MNVELQRLETFKKYNEISEELKCNLALYGLYYKGRDEVECFSCRSSFFGKCCKCREDVIKNHLKVSPNCRFLLQIDKTNLPIDPKRLILPEKSTDECGLGPFHKKTYTSDNVSEYKFFSNKENRINSFNGWTGLVKPNQLVSAGFWFTGKCDIVACWKCMVEINNWVIGDDPWLEHIKFSNECEVVKDFVNTYEGRLYSFNNWKGVQLKQSLANAGFFYIGCDDEVQSFCCGQRVKNWDRRHSAMEIHKKMQPSCKMMSFFPRIPTDLKSTFTELKLDEKTKEHFTSTGVYYERFGKIFVCIECQYSAEVLSKFVHSSDCRYRT